MLDRADEDSTIISKDTASRAGTLESSSQYLRADTEPTDVWPVLSASTQSNYLFILAVCSLSQRSASLCYPRPVHYPNRLCFSSDPPNKIGHDRFLPYSFHFIFNS